MPQQSTVPLAIFDAPRRAVWMLLPLESKYRHQRRPPVLNPTNHAPHSLLFRAGTGPAHCKRKPGFRAERPAARTAIPGCSPVELVLVRNNRCETLAKSPLQITLTPAGAAH